MIFLAQLIDRLGADLRAVAGLTGTNPTTSTVVTGVHISELEDPTPYLDGGELLLTTGIPLRVSTLRMREYVQRLTSRGVAALGVGLGVGTDVMPQDLQEACDDAGLPLFSIPAGTPFMSISRGFWELVGRREQAHLTGTLRMQTSLAQAATRPEAVESVLKVLAGAVGGWAAWLPSEGQPDVLWPVGERGVLPSLRDATVQLNLTGSRSSATFPLHGMDVVEYAVVSGTTAGTRVAGVLAVATARSLGRVDRQLMLTACTLLSIIAQQEWQLGRADAVVGRIATTLILNAHVEAARIVIEGRSDIQLPGRVRVLALSGDDLSLLGAAELGAAAAALDGAANVAGLHDLVAHSALRGEQDGLTFVILSAEQGTPGYPAVSNRGGAARLTPARLISGAIGPTTSLALIAASLPAVTLAARRARPGELLGPVGPDERRAAERVQLLRDYLRVDLVATVRSYLRHRGQWEASARELGIHRNSLRHRIGIASALIDADLDDPDTAANLWLALR